MNIVELRTSVLKANDPNQVGRLLDQIDGLDAPICPSPQTWIEVLDNVTLLLEAPGNITWELIAGYSLAKEILSASTTAPLSLLCYGPSGGGKSLIARAYATQNGQQVLSVSAADLVQDIELALSKLAEIAIHNSPVLVILDDIECFTGLYDLCPFVGRLYDAGVALFACSNRPWDIHSDVVMAFTETMYIPLPGVEQRNSIFHINLAGVCHSLTDEDIYKYSIDTEGWSGEDLCRWIREAIMQPVREYEHMDTVQPVSTEHFNATQSLITPSNDSQAKSAFLEFSTAVV